MGAAENCLSEYIVNQRPFPGRQLLSAESRENIPFGLNSLVIR